jgi:predicted site-specific integrase-resolvase
MARTPELMGIGRAAQFLGIDEGTLRRWQRQGDGPPRTRKGKRWYYSRECLKEWLKENAPSAVETKRPHVAATVQTRASIALGR